jgi:hypothetical protein
MAIALNVAASQRRRRHQQRVDWQPGDVYDESKPMPVKFKDDDGSVARQLWERSEEMLARAS